MLTWEMLGITELVSHPCRATGSLILTCTGQANQLVYPISSAGLELAATQPRVRVIGFSYPLSRGRHPNKTTQICISEIADTNLKGPGKVHWVRDGGLDPTLSCFPPAPIRPCSALPNLQRLQFIDWLPSLVFSSTSSGTVWHKLWACIRLLVFHLVWLPLVWFCSCSFLWE